MSNTKNFFEAKKEWSVTKDNLLMCYLKPYIAKIKMTHKKITIVDCFAGKGKFDDGAFGSPLIICDEVKNGLIEQGFTNVNVILIENKYHKALNTNVEQYNYAKVIPLDFETAFENVILNIDNQTNIFLYIDPYGIKNLSFSKFKSLSRKHFHSIEVLMNFNTFGFLRQACNLMHTSWEETEDGIDYDDELIDEEMLNDIANGSYWKDIVKDYKNLNKSMKECEIAFSKEYIKQLKKEFKYVIELPIKKKSQNLPKYRMIFATNHVDGLFLMCDNMNKRWNEEVERFNNNQLTFITELPSVDYFDENKLRFFIKEYLEKKRRCTLDDVTIAVISNFGCSYSTSMIYKQLKKMSKEGIISVTRFGIDFGRYSAKYDQRKDVVVEIVNN